MPPRAFPSFCKNCVISFSACFGSVLWTKGRSLHLCQWSHKDFTWGSLLESYCIHTLQQPHLFFQFYISITKIVAIALPELCPPGELFSMENCAIASDNTVLISLYWVRCNVPYERLNFLTLNLTFSVRLPGKEGNFVSLSLFPLLPLSFFCSLTSALSFPFSFADLAGIPSTFCQQSLL